MKILHLSTADANSGAAKGAYTMHKALQEIGIDSWMLVAEKYTNDPTVIGSKGVKGSQKIANGIRQTIEYWPLKQYKNKTSGLFSPAIYPSNISAQANAINPDIINLHWVAGGLLRPQDLKLLRGKNQRPLVWTLRDMWAFTGGCHYSGTCIAYQTACGQCPVLGSKRTQDLAYKGWQQKKSAWKELEITIVPLSNWLAQCVRRSSLLSHQRIEVIANAIDVEKYRPIDKRTARSVLQLPQDKQIILFGSLNPTADPRKGFSYLKTALQHIVEFSNGQFEIVVFGTDRPAKALDLKVPTTFLGRLYDDTTLALAYSSADVMVVPSLQDNFAKTIIESMACGTPVVAFSGTGAEDCITHQQNGYIANCFDSTDLAKGISWILSNSDRHYQLSENAVRTVKNKFTVTVQAKQYQKLYRSLLDVSI